MILLTVLVLSGSPGLSQSLHALDCSTEQSLPSAAEAPDAAAEAAQAAHGPSVKQFRSSPSMPSLSNCTAGLFPLSCRGCLLQSFAAILLISVVFSGLGETGIANGSGHSQDHFVSLSQAPVSTSVTSHGQKGKGTFTDDLHQLVDNWARDAISLSQSKRGPKNGATAVLGHDVSTDCLYVEAL